MLRVYYRAHSQADTAGGHSTEENLLTIQDLRWKIGHIWGEKFNDEFWQVMTVAQIAHGIKCDNGCRNIFVASNEEMSYQEGEAAQSEDQEDGGPSPSQEDQGQGPAQDGEEQQGIQDEVQPDDGQDAADEMLGSSSQKWLKIRRHIKKMALGPGSNY